jgi:hypothetical protein
MMRIVGLMSGTSADGVDAAVIEIDMGKVRLLVFDTFAYPAALRRQILNLCRPESARLDDICHYNFVLGEVFAEAVVKLCSKSGISLGSSARTARRFIISRTASDMVAGKYVPRCRLASLRLLLSAPASRRLRTSGRAIWLPADKALH